MIKPLLVLCGAVLLSVPALHAQDRRPAFHVQDHRLDGARFGGDRALAARHFGGGYGGYRGYGYGHHHYGRYYYFGGVPYFYPFFDYGFGYPAYAYGGWYGDGFGGPYGNGYGGGTYEGRIADEGSDHAGNGGSPSDAGPSLPQAVQRQLSKKGYYKGAIDGQFGPASRSALSRFQREHNLKETGRIDEDTLDALGFTDRR